jgi:CRP/FNR family transcriptional regulator/CRP/FNR family cyclic AMP-dependent transcriptional regulator
VVAADTRLATLRSCSLFSRIPWETLQELAERAHERRFAPGAQIVREGDAASGLFVIGSGRVRVYCLSEEGQQATLEILGPGESLGELALLDNGTRSASAVAMEPVDCVYLSRPDFVEVMDHSPAAMWALVRLLCHRLRRADQCVRTFVFNDVYGRVAAKLTELARSQGIQTENGIEIDLNLTQRELASLVGATRESVNKILAYYRQSGQIAVNGQRILVRAPEALARRSSR